jgi:DNA-binding NarL/FixJ family response regulator
MIRVMIVDDHPIVRQGIRSLLSNHADLALCAEAEQAESAIEQAKACQPDVILLDIRMPGMSGLDAIGALKWACPEAKVLMLSSFEDDEYLTRALQLGAYGYILKSASDERLVLAVRAAFNGERVLSPLMMDRLVKQVSDMGRERAQKQAGLSDEDVRLLRLVADGASNPKIGSELFLSEATVKRKLQDIFEKLGATTRAQAVAEAARRGVL